MRQSTAMKHITEDEQTVLDALRAHPFQKLVIIVTDACVANIKQEISLKPDPKQKK